jgi:SAM-dependent methyltransferase
MKPETYYPLRLLVCEHCWLVQTQDYAKREDLFRSDYAYFSSTSTSWLAHAASYAEKVIDLFQLGKGSFVLEIASNDGYLLRNFAAAGIPCLGIEPTGATAAVAEQIGIPVIREFFGECLGQELARSGRQADLIVGNNVYAHVPDINDFTRGLKLALKQDGVITLEFPHLMQLIQYRQFDTVYHEHFSYFSLYTVGQIFKANGLRIWHVEELPTHGGSLRVYGCHLEDSRPATEAVNDVIELESKSGIRESATYDRFQSQVDQTKNEFLSFLLEQKRRGKRIAGYGAAAKGNTLLNFAGVKPDLLPFICDAAPAKQGKYMPGSHIPILPPSHLTKCPPDYLLILPWNLAAEVQAQNAALTAMNTKFVTAIPRLEVA